MDPDLQDLVDEAARVTGMAVTLEDREFTLVAFGAHRTAGDVVRQESILTRRSTPQVRRYYESFGIAGASAPVRIPADSERSLLARVCVPVRWQSVTYGYLWLIEDRPVDPALLPELLGLAARAGVEMARRSRLRDDLGWKLGDLLSTYPDTRARAAGQIAESWSRSEATPVAAVVLRAARRAGAAEPAGPAPVNAWRLPRTVLVGTGVLGSTFLVPLTAPGDLSAARSVARAALATVAAAANEGANEGVAGGAEPGVVAGIGGPAAGLVQARDSWLQARIAARVAAGGPFDQGADHGSGLGSGISPGAGAGHVLLEWPGLGVHRLLGVAADEPLREALTQPGIDRLVSEGGPELTRTALVYLDEAGGVQRAAKILGVHRQTLYHRLERIEKLTGLDLGSGRDRLALHLALTLLPRLGSG